MDSLDRRPALEGESRAQNLVTTHDFRERGLERVHIQATHQPQGTGHVVERAARLQLVQQPNRELRIGERSFV